jgi:predicted NUDIX family NTP pyrophosphohydrolase
MGGPFWTRKDAGAWSLPKGEYDETEPARAAALREFAEELGVNLPLDAETLVELGEVRQSSGKRLRIWAGEGDVDPASVVPGTFTMPWPPRSGRVAEFPELDRVEWSNLDAARERLVKGQREFLDRLVAAIG